MSDLFKHTVSALGTENRLTSAYHPQTNTTERVNQTVKTAIRPYVGKKHTSWDRSLSHICFALRTAQHDSTGLSLSIVLYCRELDTLYLKASHSIKKRYYDKRHRLVSFFVNDLVRS